MRRGEARTRLDVDIHHPGFISLTDSIRELPNTATVSEIISSPLITGFAAGKSARAQLGDVSVLQIRPTQILLDGEIEMSGAYGIRVEDVPNRDYLHYGEVLFNNTNSTALVGKSAVFRATNPTVCSNHVTRLRLQKSVESDFVAFVLNMLRQRGYFARLCTNFNNQAGINTTTLANVRIPLPHALERKALLVEMDAARAERKAKLAQADTLLAGIDNFVLDALGIVPPEDEARRVFGVRPSQVGGEERLNAEYYHPGRTKTLSALQTTSETLRSRRLTEVVHFEREQLKTPGENYLSLAHIQGSTGELTDATNTASGNCLAFQLDDVLFARLRPYLNKVYRAEMNGCCSTEFHVLRVIDRQALLPEYLAAILRSRIVLAQTVHMMTGNTHPRLTNYDVATLTIPIPSMDIQNIIATEVNHRRDEAQRLRAEAEAGWDAAKARFEERLLGEAS